MYWAGPVINPDSDEHESGERTTTDVGTYDSHDNPIIDWRVMEMDE
jgi:hypothetical protein